MDDIKSSLKLLLIITLAIGGSYFAGYMKGWYSHSDKVNADYAKRKQQAEIKQASSVAKSQQVKTVTEVKYKTIYRDVVKYVQDPDRIKCDYDDEYRRLRQSALDADAAIRRDVRQGVFFDDSRTKEHR